MTRDVIYYGTSETLVPPRYLLTPLDERTPEAVLRAVGRGRLIIGLVLGLLAGISVPYLFNLVAMVLRHCGGM